MPDIGSNIAEEKAMLDRLAHAHKEWRDQRPPPPPPPSSPEERAARLARLAESIQKREPPDVIVIRDAREDPLRVAIWSQLSVVGWRLYAKGGSDLLTAVYRSLERDQHPGFIYAVQGAWRNIGFPGDLRGVWNGTVLL